MSSFEKPVQKNEGELSEAKLKEKAGAWLGRYEKEIADFLVKDEPKREELVDILWERGVLDRIAPLDPDEKQAREKLGKTVWKGDRDDPELYWRLLYSAAAVEENAKKQRTIAASGYGYVSGAFQGYYQAMFDEEKGTKIIAADERKRGAAGLTPDLMERARSELEKRGVTPHEKLIPLGGKGEWHGVSVTVEAYGEDGLIHLKADDREGHDKLYEYLDDDKKGVSPSRINPDDFVVEKE